MKKVALIIGHSAGSQGAVNPTTGTSEFQFNGPLAHSIAEKLILEGVEPIIIYRDGTYSELPAKVNSTGADIAVSLHCNAYNLSTNGTETLYYKGSKKGAMLASCIQEKVVDCLKFKDRGLKACEASRVGKAGDRGGYLLQKTSMPCVIVEPFFIDCDSALEYANYHFEEISEAYTQGIINYLSE